MYKLFSILGTSFLTFSILFATDTDVLSVKPDIFSANQSGQLQAQALKSSLENKIAESKLYKLKVQREINNIAGSSFAFGDTYINLLSVTSFDGNKVADIKVNGNTHSYIKGDMITYGTVLKDINNSYILIEDTSTNYSQKIWIDTGD